jgi:hypothetical protein
MPARHRRPRSSGVRGSRRTLVWATFDQSVNIAAGAQANSNLLANLQVAGSSTVGITVMRTHLELACITVVTSGDRFRVGLVIGRLGDVGNPAPVGSTTAADPGEDWLLWRHETAAPTFGEGDQNNVVRYDVRSKRRSNELDQTYILSMINDVGIAKTFNMQGRILVALP